MKSDFIFFVKSRILIAKRMFINMVKPIKFHKKIDISKLKTCPLFEVSSSLYNQIAPSQEHLRLGKIENLKICAKHLNCLYIKDGEIFSFWRQIGRPTRKKGFVAGREMRQGQLIPSIGGGICQLSSSLYQAALNSNMEIIERHGHSKVVEGAAFAQGEDANLFWNYVDLRFKASCDIILFVEVTDKELITRIYKKL